MKFELITDWKQAYSFYSMWAFALLGMAPEIFNLAVQYGMVESTAAPALLATVIKTVAFVGALTRMVKQKQVEIEAAAPVKAA
jgi:hypothetical protein